MVVLTSFVQPKDGIRHEQRNTTVYVNNNNLGKGTLYIAESCLSWVSDSGNGFSLEYPHISLHAISRDLAAFPQECLFLMLDTALGDEESNEEAEDEENENGSTGQGTTELRLVPDDRGMLDAMFHAMNACQALHPDPEDSLSDEDLYEDADDEIQMDEADSRMASLRIEHRDGYIGGRVGGILEADRGEDQEVDILGTSRGGGRTADTLGTRREAEGTFGRDADRGVGISGREGDRAVGILGADTEDMAEDTEEEWEVDTGRDDMSFPEGNMLPRDRRAQPPRAQQFHTAPERSHFDDVEN